MISHGNSYLFGQIVLDNPSAFILDRSKYNNIYMPR